MRGDRRGTDGPITASTPRLGSDHEEPPWRPTSDRSASRFKAADPTARTHGGVLDTLLADGRFSVDAVSGTSADALNWDCPGSMDG